MNGAFGLLHRWSWPALALCWVTFAPSAATAESGAVAVDAGVMAADAGAVPPYARDFERQARQIRAFLAGQLDPGVDPQSLFDLPLDTPEARLGLEIERLGLVLRRVDGAPAEPSEPSVAEAGAAADQRQLQPAAWRARLELDRARLAFYQLPSAQRAELVRTHQARREQALPLEHDEAKQRAEAEAQRAAEQQREALEAARRSSTEAARLINEEHARLLAITRQQAEYASAMIERRANLDARGEATLGWRRKVAELTAAAAVDAVERSRVDAAYVELRAALRQARQKLSETLGAMGEGVERVPRAGPDPLVDLTADADPSVAVQQRQTVNAKARELARAEESLEAEEAEQLMTQVEIMNRLRLDLLDSLSPEKRSSILDLGPAGWDQALAELWQVALTLRYHGLAAFDWLAAIRHGDRRGQSAWLALSLVLKWALPIGLFVWWRRRADAVLLALGERPRKARERREGDWFRVDAGDRWVAFLRRVRRPLEWLLLVGIATWLMPGEMKGLLEVRLASRVLLWVLGGLFVVLSIDALAASGARLGGGAPSAELRLRSLRLVGRAVVAFGLVLSLSDLLVGQGTVYSWVFSTCWFAAIPLLFVIIGWWRPFIFERFTRIRRPTRFEGWIIRNAAPAPGLFASMMSSLAAVAGGVYLFFTGALRVVRGRVLSFELTRRLLAYLFRRDLSKKALESAASGHSPLPAETFHALGPEVAAGEPVPSAADALVHDVIRRTRAAGGGAVAIVGERGAGKTTFIQRIVESCPELVAITCGAEGLSGLRGQLNQALGLAATSELIVAAKSIDGRAGDRGVLIDDAHQLVRPVMGGLGALDEVFSVVRRHSKNCTWVLTFDEAIWRFIERSRSARPLFDDVVYLNPWSEEAIVRLITQRSRAAGLEPDFRELTLDLPANADEVDVGEAVRRTETSYYRLLWDYASGNPAVALHFWRRSLGVAPSGQVSVRLFEAPDTRQLEALPDAAAFVLRAIVQLGWASVDDITRATSLSKAQVEDTLRFGSQQGYFEVHAERYRINWDWFRAVTRLLHRRHLSFPGV